MPKLTDKTTITTLASGDLVHVVDISDVTSSAQGTSKKSTIDNLKSNFNVSGQTVETVAIYNASGNLESAATAQYPSIVELAHVKGVTSAIQTQLNAKISLADLSSSDVTVDNLISNNRISTGVNRETLSAAKTIVSTDVQNHFLDPNGADRDVTLYASPVAGDFFIFKNRGTANVLTLKNNGGSTIIVIGINVAVGVQFDGTEWQLV